MRIYINKEYDIDEDDIYNYVQEIYDPCNTDEKFRDDDILEDVYVQLTEGIYFNSPYEYTNIDELVRIIQDTIKEMRDNR